MTELLGLFVVLVLGPGFLTLGIWSLRTKAWRESVPLAEAVIDRAFGIEPPPRNKWDRRFALVQAWLFTILGALFTLCAAALLISDFVSE